MLQGLLGGKYCPWTLIETLVPAVERHPKNGKFLRWKRSFGVENMSYGFSFLLWILL